jgi:hypothetical protein
MNVTASTRKPLYGHTDEQSAYLVQDYPYGSMRCRIRYWLENTPKKGFRFVSQTENPKTLRWNAPKKSTYVKFAGCMYLDEKDHVQWDGVSEYTNASKVLDFVKDFPHADFSVLRMWAKEKAKYELASAHGKVVWSINGVEQPVSEEDMGRARKDYEEWMDVLKHLH